MRSVAARFLITPSVLLAGLLLFAPAVSRGAESPAAADAEREGALARAVVESLHEVLMKCMKQAEVLGFEGRYELVAANLDSTFDLPFMARLSVASAWPELDVQQREDFVALSRRLSAVSYAHNFDGYGGQRFETLSHEPAPRRTILVKTRLVNPEDKDVLFDYRLRKAGEAWRIIDVQLDGKISELTLRRADYRAVIERRGFPVLVAEIEKKIEELSRE